MFEDANQLLQVVGGRKSSVAIVTHHNNNPDPHPNPEGMTQLHISEQKYTKSTKSELM